MQKNNYQVQFGISVRKHRNAKNLTQEELANLAELDRTYIGSVERGERNVGLVNIHKIANALKVEVKELFC
ncbi:XRE family transcriptional regulator [Thalassotalea euphylliae]|uniref:XRE family transcriptional regulator n=1 Tax=Thalassotalea euphylliae TaxID=1655234 RepID=A0A3E0TUS4_9GAMM|nr:helix-turn-helix transcriptional regulator [Thalassotalea euphylliae]REL28204.1 XRE family transcriptional regulator [Thalassotalea euphylliae]